MTEHPKKPPKRNLRWEAEPRKIPAHPYRDSAILYAILAGIVVAVTVLTGGNTRTALILAPLLFVVATGYSWWRWRQREQQAAREEK